MTEDPAYPVFASAVSDAADARDAVDQALSQIAGKINAPVDMALVFVSPHHVDGLTTIHRRLQDTLSPAVCLGVTAGGVIGRGMELEESSGLSLMVASMPGVALHPFSYEQIDWPAVLENPDELRQTLVPGTDGTEDDLRAILLFADPFSAPMVNLLPVLGQCWPNVPVIGGMASGGSRPGLNRLLLNGQVLRTGAVGLAIRGNISVQCTLSQGCRPIGKPYVITQSKRHLLYQLGGKAALGEIQHLINDIEDSERELIQTRGLMLGRVINEYKERHGRGDFLIRHLVGVDQEAGYIAVNDPQIRVGQTVQFHVHDQQTAREDFKLLLEAQKIYGDASGALLFSCNGRGQHLFDQPNTDACLVHDALGGIPLAGFFAAGEIGPVGGENFLHGHTASLAVFRPLDDAPTGDQP